MKLSERGSELIESFEGFRSNPYTDAVGVWTIGFGSTRGVGPNTPVSREQARARLMREVDATYGAAINALKLGLNQNQFDALTSFVYNVGTGGVGPDTRVGRALRDGDHSAAADALLAWDKAGGRRLAGLTRRRQAERALFLRPARDPFVGYSPAEKRWIGEYDQLRRRGDAVARARMKVLVSVMTRQRKRIWRLAQAQAKGGDGHGWDHGRRRTRYHSLLVRTTG